MATPKKKVNYIGYELTWLEKKCKQLQKWVEDKLDGEIRDRIEVYESTRGNPIIKVIASEEAIIKALRDTLKELPNMLLEINRLKKIADEEDSPEKMVMGDYDIPGFMDDDTPVIKNQPEQTNTILKELPPSTSEFDSSDYIDDFENFEEP